jgi:cytochrome c biogenesis protein CcmG, thiol:disulfide interchange protein DsbE
MKRLVGGLVIGGLVAMFALNLVWIVKNKNSLGGTKAGQDAPDLSLPLLDGGQQRLSDWRGQVVVLNFWATWCAPCVHELPDVQRLFAELSPRGVKFLAVDVDGGPPAEVAPLVRAFKNKIGLSMPIALDDGGASQAYRVDTIPRTIIIGKDGRVAEVLDGVHPLDEMRRAVLTAM